MSRKYTPDEWIEKADHKGGVHEGLKGGLSEDDIDEEEYPYFHDLVREAWDAYINLDLSVNAVLNYNVEDEKDYAEEF